MKKVRQKSTARQQAKKARNSGSRRVLRRERGWQHFCASHLPQIVVGCISVALLLIALIGAHLPAFANATLTTRASTFSSPHPLETGGLLRFTDPKDRTALSVQTNPNDTHYGVFTFTNPAGEQYYGGNVNDLFFRGNDLLVLRFPNTLSLGALVGGRVETFGGPTGTGVAIVTLTGTISLVNDLAEVVLTDFTLHQQFFMNSSPEPDNEMTVVDNFNMAVTTQSPQLFNLTSRFVTAGYNAVEFNKIVQSQFQIVGRIMRIVAEMPSQPMTDPAGITYFTVIEHITHLKNDGSTPTDRVIAVFILEDGQWKFWFSHPA